MSSRSHPLNSTDTTKMEKIMSDLMKNNDELPEGWEWKRLGQIAEVVAGNPAPQGEEYFRDGRYPFLRVQDMGRLGNDSYIYKTHDYINDKAVQSLRLFPKGSVLFTKSGASTLLNQRAILCRDMFVVSHIAATIPHDGIMSEWLYYWLKTVDFNKLAHATTLPSLPLSKAKDIHIPIAPPVEQKLIVSEIEKQFSRLDEAVAALKRVRASLNRYKASVLKAAVEGRLTEEWRKENPDVEPVDKLLKRILAERKKKWEEKNPKKKYKEPSAPDTPNLPDLPEGWVWASIGQVVECLDSIRVPVNKKERAKRQGTTPYYGANGQVGWIDDYIFNEPLVLVVEDETFTGRELPFSYKITGKSWVNNHAHILRNTKAVDIDYLNHSLAHYSFTPLTTGTTGRKKLTQAALLS